MAAAAGCGGEAHPPAPSAAGADVGRPYRPFAGPGGESPDAEARAEAEEGAPFGTAGAVERLARLQRTRRDHGFANVAVYVQERRIDLWWHGPLPARARAEVAAVRQAGRVTVRVRQAAHSHVEYDRMADRIFADARFRTAGVEVVAMLGNLGFSSVEIHITEPPPGLSAEQKAARCALAGRLAHEASGLRVRKVDDRGEVLEVNSPNPCGAPGVRNVGPAHARVGPGRRAVLAGAGPRKGVGPVESVHDMARPGLFDSDEDLEAFLAHVAASRRRITKRISPTTRA